MMPVVEAGRRELLEPDLEVVNQSILPVVHEHAGGDMHRRDQHQAFADAALLHDGGQVVRDADELLLLPGVEVQILGRHLHSASDASAFKSAGANVPARSLRSPAAAIIAALSVDSRRLGRKTGISRASPRATSSARSRLLAETPPAIPTLRA